MKLNSTILNIAHSISKRKIKSLIAVVMCVVMVVVIGGCSDSRKALTNEEVQKHFESNGYSFACSTEDSITCGIVSDDKKDVIILGTHKNDDSELVYLNEGNLYAVEKDKVLSGSKDAATMKKKYDAIMKKMDIKTDELNKFLKEKYNEEKAKPKEDKDTEDNSATENKQSTESETKRTPEDIGNENALKKAKDYISYDAFSQSGLIKQLEFEGFSNSEAQYGADNCGADWNEQAKKKAKDYMDYDSFSKQGLIDQLVFEGFTQEQAEAGAASVGF